MSESAPQSPHTDSSPWPEHWLSGTIFRWTQQCLFQDSQPSFLSLGMLLSTVTVRSCLLPFILSWFHGWSLSGKYFISKFLGEDSQKLTPPLLLNGFFPFHGFPFPFLGPLEPLLWLSLLMYICYELDLLGGALSASLNLCSFVLRPLFRAL